jgi:hypothetical protein
LNENEKLTERRMPIPVKITAAGWDTCMPIKYQIRNNFKPEDFGTCQADTASDDSGKRAEDIDGGAEPLCQIVVGTTRSVEPGNLFIEYVEDGIWRIAVLEFVEQRMGTEIFLSLLLVSFDGIVEDGLIVRGRCGCSGGIGHVARVEDRWEASSGRRMGTRIAVLMGLIR